MPLTGRPPIRFTVVAPFYNVEKYIRACVEGLLTQAYPADAYTVILVDNNSRDRSAAIAREYPGVTVLTELKQGQHAARNLGIRHSSGDAIAFIDPDCVPQPDWLARLALGFQEPGTGIVLGRRDPDSTSRVLAIISEYRHLVDEHTFKGADPHRYYGHTNNMAVRLDLFHTVGLLEELPRGGDTVFVRRAIARLGPGVVHYEPAARVRHLELDSVASYWRKGFIWGKGRAQYRPLAPLHPLAMRERLRFFTRATSEYRCSAAETVVVLATLAVALSCYNLGDVAIQMSTRRRDGAP